MVWEGILDRIYSSSIKSRHSLVQFKVKPGSMAFTLTFLLYAINVNNKQGHLHLLISFSLVLS